MLSKNIKRAMNGDNDHKIPDVFDGAYDTCCRCRYHIVACHRCLLDIRMGSCPQYFKLPQHLVALFIKSAPSELPPATTTTAYQTYLMSCTTLAAVMGSVLTPVIAARSIYGCAHILNISLFLSIWWHFYLNFHQNYEASCHPRLRRPQHIRHAWGCLRYLRP